MGSVEAFQARSSSGRFLSRRRHVEVARGCRIIEIEILKAQIGDGASDRCGRFRGGCAARVRTRSRRGPSNREGAGAAGLIVGEEGRESLEARENDQDGHETRL
jgi:hypothetical protein